MIKNDTKVVVTMTNKSHDIPFADTFLVHEHWLIISPFPNERCIIR